MYHLKKILGITRFVPNLRGILDYHTPYPFYSWESFFGGLVPLKILIKNKDFTLFHISIISCSFDL